MVAANPAVADVVRDAAWLAHRYDPIGDAVHFQHVPRDRHRAATFLTDEYLADAGAPLVIGRKAAMQAMAMRFMTPPMAAVRP